MYSIDICQKEPPEVLCEKRCSEKFRKIYRKAPVLKPQASKFIKKETATQVFPDFCEKFQESPHQKQTKSFLVLSLGIKWEHVFEMG